MTRWFSAVLVLACLLVTPARAADFMNPVFNDRLWYEAQGDRRNPAVVLIHGLGPRASRDWDALAPKLANRFYVVRLDLPGFGRSARPDALYNPRNLAASVDALMQHLRIPSAIVVGHSMGGTVALRLALDHPERVQRLVLAAIAGVLHHSVFGQFVAGFGIDQLVPKDSPVGSLLDVVARETFQLLDQTPLDTASSLGAALAIPELRQTVLGGDPQKIAGLALALEDFSGELDRVKAPALIIWDEGDRITPRRTGSALAARLPNARLEVLPGAHHMLVAQHPERIAELIADFAKPQPPASARTARSASVDAADPTALATCDGERGARFTGRYKRIELKRCIDALLDHVEAESVVSEGSTLRIQDSVIRGAGAAIEASASEIEITASRIEGATGILLHGGSLDAAGSTIAGQTSAIRATQPARAVFSISTLRSQGKERSMHGVLSLPGAAAF